MTLYSLLKIIFSKCDFEIGFLALSQFQNIEFLENINVLSELSGIYEHAQFRWINIIIKEVMRFVKLFKYGKLKIVKWMEIV